MSASDVTGATVSVRDDEFLSPTQVEAKFQGLTVNTLAMWRKYDVGPTYLRMGRRVWYPEALLQQWCDEHLHVCRPEIRNLRPRR